MENCTDGLTTSQKDTVLYVMSSVGLVSFMSCVLILVLLFYLKLHKRFIYRLAMYQVISSMMVSVSEIFVISATSYVQDYSETLYNDMCIATAFFMTYNIWVKLLFTSSLTLHLFLMAVCLKEFKKLEIVHVLVSVGFPLLWCWIPFIGDHYGPAGAWCWIAEKNSNCSHGAMGVGAIEQLAVWYVPCNTSLVLCIVATVIASIVLIWRGVKKGRCSTDEETQLLIQTQRQTRKALLEVAPLLAYPAIFFIFNSFATANRIYNALIEQPSFALLIIHAVTVSLWGICSSIALLLHITLTRYLNKRRNNDSDLRTAHTGDDRIAIYTNYDDTGSYYNIPRESVVDKLIEGEKEARISTRGKLRKKKN